MAEDKKKSRLRWIVPSVLGIAAAVGTISWVAYVGVGEQKQQQQRYEAGKELVCVVPLQESYVSRLDMLTSQGIPESRYGLRVRSDDSAQVEYDLVVLGSEKDDLRTRVQEASLTGLEHSLKLCFPRGNELRKVNDFANAEGRNETYLNEDQNPSVVYKLADRVRIRGVYNLGSFK